MKKAAGRHRLRGWCAHDALFVMVDALQFRCICKCERACRHVREEDVGAGSIELSRLSDAISTPACVPTASLRVSWMPTSGKAPIVNEPPNNPPRMIEPPQRIGLSGTGGTVSCGVS
jgi:hypothetical protein